MSKYKEVRLNRYRSIADDEVDDFIVPPPPQCSPNYDDETKNINKKKYPSRKEREYFEKEEKWKHLMANTIVLTPDRISRIRKKIIVKGIQIDVESFLLGGIVGIILAYYSIMISY